MPDSAYDFLTNFFVTYLPFTPTARQVELFQADLSLVSPFLMEASLREVVAGTVGNILAYTPNEWRPEIFKIYNRKVAEQAQLFPVFHSFETAFRSTVAVSLEHHYSHARWWAGIDAAIRRGDPPNSVKQISGVTLNRDAADTIGRIVEALNYGPTPISTFTNGYQFVECCDLGHIGSLIEKHWSVFSGRFVRGTKRLSANDFHAKFTRVRDARNDVYHHKSVARMANVVSTAEDLLDYLDFSLGFVYSKTTGSNPTALTFSVPPAARHRIW